MYGHPDDFVLYELGEFDDTHGIFVAPPDGIPVALCRGKDVKVRQE